MGLGRFGGRLRGSLPVSAWLRGGGGVKSVQRGTITLANGVTSNTATITAVVLANTRLVYLGNTSENAGGSGAAPTVARLAMTNETTVTASRITGTDAAIVSFEVVEYFPFVIRSVQRGTVTMTATTTENATIAAVNVAKATIDVLGWEANTAHSADAYRGRTRLANATTVTVDRILNNGNLTTGYQVVEWG